MSVPRLTPRLFVTCLPENQFLCLAKNFNSQSVLSLSTCYNYCLVTPDFPHKTAFPPPSVSESQTVSSLLMAVM